MNLTDKECKAAKAKESSGDFFRKLKMIKKLDNKKTIYSAGIFSVLLCFASYPLYKPYLSPNNAQYSGCQFLTQGEYENAAKLFKISANRGNPKGENYLAMLYQDGKGVNKDDVRAFSLALSAAKKGYSPAQRRTAIYFHHGIGTKIDFSQALHWYRHAAESGDRISEYYMFLFYRGGYFPNVEKDQKKAFEWATRASNQGHLPAKTFLALMLMTGEGTHKDVNRAAELLLDAALKHHPNAQFLLSMLYKGGVGVTKNTEKYLEWLTKAAENNFPDAQAELAAVYETGYAIEKNSEMSLEWAKKAANQGSIEAQRLLSVHHMKSGEMNEAYFWALLASKVGHENPPFTYVSDSHMLLPHIESKVSQKNKVEMQRRASSWQPKIMLKEWEPEIICTK